MLQRFQRFWVEFQENSELILATIDRMEDLTLLVQIRPAVCACALMVFLVPCACSQFFNAGQSSGNSSQRVLIVLDSILLLKWMRIGS